jgi:hypothetical protein
VPVTSINHCCIVATVIIHLTTTIIISVSARPDLRIAPYLSWRQLCSYPKLRE